MEGYTFLTPAQARAIRVGRVRQLEEEHYSTLLVLEEKGGKDETALNAVDELERRIEHHLKVLTGESVEQSDAQEPLLETAERVNE